METERVEMYRCGCTPILAAGHVLAKAFVLLAVAAMLAGAPRPAAAEDWPTRPVTMLISFAPAR